MQPPAFARCALLAAVLSCSVPSQGQPEQEPNDTAAQAGLHTLGDQSYGVLSAGDEDWFRVVLPQAGDLRAWTAPGFQAQAGDTRLALLDASGQLVLEVDDGSPATHGAYSLLEAGDLDAGTWFLRVRGGDPQTTGGYTLDVEVLGPGQLVPVSPPVTTLAEAIEPNDPRLSGSAPTGCPLFALASGHVATGAWSAGYSVPGADYDFYKLYIPSSGLLELETSAGAAPALADSVLHLADAGLQRLAYDDDSGAGFQARLRFAVSTPGLYYAVVSGYGAGNYDLSVSFRPPMPSGQAMVTVHGGGCGPTGGVPHLGTRWTTGTVLVRIERPVIGTRFFLDLTNAPPNRLLARLFNLLPRAWPMSLQPLGAPGCVSEVDDPAVTFANTDAQGVHFWGLALPADASMIGLPLEQQVAVYDPAANALGVRMSNRVSITVGVEF